MGKLLDSAICFENNWIKPLKSFERNQTISVIIPVFHPEHIEQVVFHLQKIGGFNEIILVDDSGSISENDYNFVKLYENVHVIYHENNLGRSCARNTGASYSESDILVFIDQDMFLNPLFFKQLTDYFRVNKSLIFLGCRETVDYNDISPSEDWIEPDLSKEWRMKTRAFPEFVDLTIMCVGGINNNCNPDEIISIYDKTDRLSKLGIREELTVGFWDLPSMVISHSMAILREDFYTLGGFPEWVCGWGGEDIVLGFCACAAHIPIYLSKLSSYQAFHKPYSGSEEKKINELKRNISKYKKWARVSDAYPVFLRDEYRIRGHRLI